MNRSLSLVLLLFTGLLLPACSLNPATGRNQFILLSGDQVAKMGEDSTPGLIAEYGGEVESKALRDYVTSVGMRLAEHVEPEYGHIDWTFYTLEADIINAFALPGGRVFICKGLLKGINNEAELAAVLGHEIGHVTGRHIDERVSRTLAKDFGVAVLGIATESQLALAGVELFGNGYLLSFNRDQESESDSQGLKYMTRAGYNPEGMIGLLELLADSMDGDRVPEILATHPHPDTRLERVREEIRKRYSEMVNNPNYRDFAERYARDARRYLG